MSFTDYLPWNWFGGESRLEQSQDLPPPHLDETDQSVLRDDDFSTSTPAPRTDRPTTVTTQWTSQSAVKSKQPQCRGNPEHRQQ